MLTNTSATLYKFNGTGFDRFFISAVFWYDSNQARVTKSGLNSAAQASIFIPLKSITSDNTPKTPSKDMFVKGNCEFEFDNTSQKTVSERMKEFRGKYEFVTISDIEEKLYGSKHMRHVLVLCRKGGG